MRAKIVKVSRDAPDVITVRVDFEPFEDYNQAFETANYYDDEGRARLTAREAQKYKAQHNLYFGPADEVEAYLKFEDSNALTVYTQYVQAQSGKPYVAWLEEQVLSKTQAQTIAS